MAKVPSAVWVVDTNKEHIAVGEARKLGIPVIAILDTNCDPDEVDYPIPGNDDAIRSVALLTRVIADAVADGLVARAGAAAGDAKPEAVEPAPTSRSPSGSGSCSAVTPRRRPSPRTGCRGPGRRRGTGSRGTRPRHQPRPAGPDRGTGRAGLTDRHAPRIDEGRNPMANYTAADVKRLRELTGAGMMDCKKALDEADGDFDKAVELLRIKGAKDVGKRAERTAANGLVARPRAAPDRAQLRDRLRRQERRVPGSSPTQIAARGAATEAASDVEALAAADARGRQTVQRGDRRPGRGHRREARAGSRCRLRRRRAPSTCTSGPATCRRGRRARRLRRRRRRRRPRRGDAGRGRCARSTSPVTTSPRTSSRTSAGSPRRPPARRASPSRRCPKIVEGRVNGFYKEVVLLEQPSVQDQKKTRQAGARRGGRHASAGSPASRSARSEADCAQDRPRSR